MKQLFCGTCGENIQPGQMSVRCRLCMSNYHSRCWEKAGGCTTWGCPGRNPSGAEVNGQAVKRCPSCGEEVAEFATRCRYCRSSFEPGEAVTNLSPSKKTRGETDRGFRKDPILTSLLNLIFPGAGYMYLGQFGKGLFWFLIAIAAWFLTRGFGLIAVYLWVMYDSARQAVYINRGISPKTRNIGPF